MNFKLPRLNTNIWIILSALLILVFFYLFYLEYYVKTKESRITSTRFRVLDQLGKNVDKRLASFLSNAGDLEKKVEGEWKQARIDVWRKLCPDRLSCLINRLNTRGDINKNLKVMDILKDSVRIASIDEIIKQRSAKTYNFSVKIDNPPFETTPAEGEAYLLLEASYASLIEGLDRTDVFDDLILIRDSVVVYNTLEQEMILEPEKPGDRDAGKGENSSTKRNLNMGESVTHLGILFSGETFDLTISNKVYRAFLKPIEVNKETWYALGLMKKSKYQATSRGIEPWLIIMLSLILIFIILGMPVIKLRVMSSTEQLDTSTIISYALSVVLGGAILVLFIFFLSQDYLHRTTVNHRLESLSDELYEAFTGELDSAYLQLEAYDVIYDQIDFADTANYFKNDIAIDILNKEEPLYPSIYPYGDYYFWVKENGVQSAYLTPDDNYGKFSNLSKRDYVNKKDEWFLPRTNDKKFRIESIVSVTSGAVKGAISKESVRKKEDTPVVAMSSRFYSIINAILPKDYAFCIIDNSGKVWFHSNENLNLKENFINECNDSEYLKAAIYSGISKSINVDYYNYPHRIYIRPIDRLPLYMVTMYNKKASQSFQAQVITITLALIGFLLLMLFIQVVALLVIERRYRLRLTRNFIMKLTRPIMRLNGRYKFLTRVHLIIILVITPFMFWFSDIHAIAAIFTLTIILFTFSYWTLNDNEFKKPHRKWFVLFNFGLLILVNIICFVLLKGEDSWKVILFEAVIIITLLICDRLLKKDEDKINDEYWTSFTRLLVLILLLLGILPALKFYELAYNTEREIRTMQKLIEIGNQREMRNLELDAFYGRFKGSNEVEKVEDKRREKGIYTDFMDIQLMKKWKPSEDFDSLSKNNYWDTLIVFIRPFYDDYITENKYLILTKLDNQDIRWFSDGRQLVLRYNSLTEKEDPSVIYPYYISSLLKQISFYTPFNGGVLKTHQAILYNIIFWLIVLILAFIFYKLLTYGVFRIFCHDIIENYHHQDFDKVLRQQILANKDIFVTRLSPRDESEYFTKAFLSEEGTYSIDWSETENVSATPKKVNYFLKQQQKNGNGNDSITLLVDRFASGYEDPKYFEEKLKIIKTLTNRKEIKLVIFSQFSPEAILDYYKGLIDELKAELIEQSKRISYKLELIQSVYSEFSELNKILIIDYLPVRYHQPPELIEKYCFDKPRIIQNEEMIMGELNASDYLTKYEPALLQYKEDYCDVRHVDNPEELIVTKINSLAENYFEDLFNNCTPEEKYVLFDLAYDQIMNPKNDTAIVSLLQKGLLVKKCYKVNFMNISFRRFIISKINKESRAELDQALGKESGTWQGYRATLIMVIVGLFVFIALANQDFLDDLNQLFVAIGGGVAVITGVLGLLSSKSRKTAD